MFKEILIFSIGMVVGMVVCLAINGVEIDINVNHDINLPTGIVIGGATPTNQANQSMSEEWRKNLMLIKMQNIWS